MENNPLRGINIKVQPLAANVADTVAQVHMAKGRQLAGIDIELSVVSVEPERPLHNHYMTGAVIYPGRLIVGQGIGLYMNGPGRISFRCKGNAGPRAHNQ